MTKNIRLLLVDDLAMFRASLRVLIESQQGLTVVGEAGTLADAVAIASQQQPDIILLDVAMSDENGLEYISRLLQVATRARVLVVTAIQDEMIHRRAVQMGAMGLVLKQKDPDVLMKAIEKVHLGEAWLDRMTIGSVLAELSRSSNGQSSQSDTPSIDALTKREREIISLVAQGLKNKQIAEQLSISDITVRHHLTSIFSKLEVADRFELIIYAYRSGLCDLSKA